MGLLRQMGDRGGVWRRNDILGRQQPEQSRDAIQQLDAGGARRWQCSNAQPSKSRSLK